MTELKVVDQATKGATKPEVSRKLLTIAEVFNSLPNDKFLY